MSNTLYQILTNYIKVIHSKIHIYPGYSGSPIFAYSGQCIRIYLRKSRDRYDGYAISKDEIDRALQTYNAQRFE